jgi:hypothetical protein
MSGWRWKVGSSSCTYESSSPDGWMTRECPRERVASRSIRPELVGALPLELTSRAHLKIFIAALSFLSILKTPSVPRYLCSSIAAMSPHGQYANISPSTFQHVLLVVSKFDSLLRGGTKMSVYREMPTNFTSDVGEPQYTTLVEVGGSRSAP